MFLSSEYFILFHSGGLSKISYLVPYQWSVFVVVSNGRSVLGCAKRVVSMLTMLKVISLTGVCSSLAVAILCFVGVDVVDDSK